MFVTAAIHGDELNGVEIIRRTLRILQPGNISGTLLCVPVVNAYGFIGRSRYLPDRRDLQSLLSRFAQGSLAGRLANILLTEVVRRCEIRNRPAHCRRPSRQISPRSAPTSRAVRAAANYRKRSARRWSSKAPSVRARSGRPRARWAWMFSSTRAARGFASMSSRSPPVSTALPASCSASACCNCRQCLVYAASAALRAGICRCLEVGAGSRRRRVAHCQADRRCGQRGRRDRPRSEPLRGRRCARGRAVPRSHLGRTTLPIVNMGDALFHIAWSEELGKPKMAVNDTGRTSHVAEPVLDEDEISRRQANGAIVRAS